MTSKLLRRSALAMTLALIASLGGAAARATGVDRLNHIVVLMQENRSFDNYFGHLDRYDPSLDLQQFNGEPGDAANPDPISGGTIQAFHESKTCEVADLEHGQDKSTVEYANGTNQGFTRANENPLDPNGHRTMGYYTDADIPYYYSLADTFGVADRYFASFRGPTFPNRFFLLAGTNFGHQQNDFPVDYNNHTASQANLQAFLDGAQHGFSQRNIFNELDEKHVTWKIYYEQVAFGLLFANVRAEAATHVFPIADYFADAAAGNLPQVTFIDPVFVGSNNTETDEHPPVNIQVGQESTAQLINAFMLSPNWNDGAFFLTYDEHGGFYDHVVPGAATPPDSIADVNQAGVNPDGRTDADNDNVYGFRVPFVVVSPFAIRHNVSHTLYDHTSITKFIEDRFGLGTLTARDAAANTPVDMFDFTHPNTSLPALSVPLIDPQHWAECAQLDLNRDPTHVGF